MIKVIAYVLIIGGLSLGWFSLGSITPFAHSHVGAVCEAGNDLVSESTTKQKVSRFVGLCEQAEKKHREIFGTVYRSSIFSGLIGIIIVVIGFLLNMKFSLKSENSNA